VIKKWIGLFCLSACAIRADTLTDAIVKHYGIEAFARAKEIRFTFHAAVLGMGPSHTWIFKPQADSVFSVDQGKGYSRKSVGAEFKSLDKGFINDWYWLSFPLHLALDKGVKIETDGAASLSPLGKESLTRVKVTYMEANGYTPNELWAAPDGSVREWKYHRHGAKAGAKWTWDKPETRGGITFATDHRGLVHIWFTDIEVH
jgi:hypothetical protein